MHQENVGRGMAPLVSRFRIPPGFRSIRLKPDDTPHFGWQTEDTEPDDDYRSMGKVPGKGYAFVDTDPRNNSNVEEELVEKYGEKLISGWVERTPGGGFHIPVRLPEDLWYMPQSQNGKDAKDLPSLPHGVDIKVGGKGYGLAAGSRRAKDGGCYTLAQEGPVIDLPEAVANDIRRDLAKKRTAKADAALAEVIAAVGSTNGGSKAPSTGYAREDPPDAATRIMADRAPPDDWHEWSKLCCAFLSAGKSVNEVEDWCRKNPRKYHAFEDRRFLEKQVAHGYGVGIGYAIMWDRRMGGTSAPKAKSKKHSGQLWFSVEQNKKERGKKRARVEYAWRLFKKGLAIATIADRVGEMNGSPLKVETVEGYLREAMKEYAKSTLEEMGELTPLDRAVYRQTLDVLGEMSRGRLSSLIATRENRTLDRRIERYAGQLSVRKIAEKVGLERSAVADRVEKIERHPWLIKPRKEILLAVRRDVRALKKARREASRVCARVRARVKEWTRKPAHMNGSGRDAFQAGLVEVTGCWNGKRLVLDKPLGGTKSKSRRTIERMWDEQTGRVINFR